MNHRPFSQSHPEGAPPANAPRPLPRPSPRALAQRVQMALSRRARLVVGTLIVRLCNSDRRECRRETCQLRPLRRCAMDELRANAAVEWKIWAVLGACGCALLAHFFMRG